MDKRSLLVGVAPPAIGFAVHGTAMADPIEIKFFDRYTSAGQTDFSKCWSTLQRGARRQDPRHMGRYPGRGLQAEDQRCAALPRCARRLLFVGRRLGEILIDSGYAAPLNTYYEKYGWAKTMSPAGLKLATFDGTQYFVPTMMSASLVWYRPDIFQKVGIHRPRRGMNSLRMPRRLRPRDRAHHPRQPQRWPAQFLWSGIL